MKAITDLIEKTYFYSVSYFDSGEASRLMFHTRGDGLYPLIKDSDILHIDPTASDLHVGDLTLFESQNGRLFVHCVLTSMTGQNGARLVGKIASIDRNGQTKRCDDRFARLCHITYSVVRPLMLMFLLMRKILSLFQPRFFVKDVESSLGTVARKFNEEEEVFYHSQGAFEGFDEHEQHLVEQYMKRRGRVLNIGCGPGRESFVLAGLGFQVTGIDVAPRMIEAAGRIAASRGQDIRFEVKSATNLDYPVGSFDYVFMAEGVYSLIPTRDVRIDVLRKIGKLLVPDGTLLFSALYRRAAVLSRVSLYSVLRKITKRFLGRRLHSEPGDTLVRYISPVSKASTLCYVHLFRDAGEVREEVSSAGLDGFEDPRTGYWVVRPLKAGNVQGGIGEEADSRLSDPTASDSEAVLEYASAHGLTFLLQGLPGLPASVQERVHRQCLNITARNMALAGELRIILRAFRGQGIQCLPLRGLALAEQLYDSLPPRPLGDIDLLVRREDLPRVQALFQELGFTEMDRRPGFAAAFSYTLKFFIERSFMVIAEPHWTIAYPPFVDRLDMEAVWDRCVPARVVGEETLSLGREDLLVHLCLHLVHRDDAPFLWLYELDRFLRQESEAMTWDLIVSVSREVGVEGLVGRALNQAVAKLRTPVPAAVLDGLGRREPGSARPFAERMTLTSGVDGIESLATFFTIKGLGPKLRYARALLFPEDEFMMLQYGLTHRRQLPATYLRRLCWFSWQAAKGLVHMCVR